MISFGFHIFLQKNTFYNFITEDDFKSLKLFFFIRKTVFFLVKVSQIKKNVS